MLYGAVRWRRSSNKDSDEPEVQVGLCFVLSLNHMGGKNLHLGTNSKNCYQKWMALLRDFITGNALSAAEDLHCGKQSRVLANVVEFESLNFML